MTEGKGEQGRGRERGGEKGGGGRKEVVLTLSIPHRTNITNYNFEERDKSLSHISQWIAHLPLSCTCAPFAPGTPTERCEAVYWADFEELQIVMVGII